MVVALLVIGVLEIRAQPTTVGQANVPPPTDYRVVQADGNSRMWQREVYEAGPNGEVVTNLQTYTELATGLNFLDTNAQFQASQEEIDMQPDGTASATHGQHQAYFPSDILNGEIELVTPDGKHLKSQPSALAYDDGSNTVLIAVLTNSVGQVINNNQVIYTNAFVGLAADLAYTYTKAGFEQDVVLREQPPTPESLGLNAATARLQILTEFFNPPQPVQTTSVLPEQSGMTLTDGTLNFGAMQMVPGKAFLLGNESSSARVCKSWIKVEGRQFLVEEVPMASLTEALGALPLASGQNKPTIRTRFATKNRALPPAHLARVNNHSLRLAKAEVKWKPGLLLDYSTVNSSLTNYTFQGDSTYFISGNTTLFGTSTFEGGTIIKYTNGVSLNISGSAVNWAASAYRPVIMTAKDDNSVGWGISGSTGSPSGYYANPALSFTSATNLTLSNARILYAKQAIAVTSSSLTNFNFQAVNCQNALTMNSEYGYTVYFRNALFANVATNLSDNSSYGSVDVQNATISGVNCLIAQAGSALTINITNCIFANVTNTYSGSPTFTLNANKNGFYNSPNFGPIYVTSTIYPFQNKGAASYYLTNGCNFHNAGTTSIDPNLLADLTNKTTYAPLIYSNYVFSTPTTLSPVAQRDNTGSPDLGYHYDALDYIVGGCDLSTNLTFAPGTDVGWFYSDEPSSGIACNFLLASGANLTFNGTATSPCWMARFTTVQETVNGAWPLGSSQPGLELNGSVTGVIPQLNAHFSRWSVLADDAGQFQDNRALGNAYLSDSEFYIANIVTYKMSSLYFTNCLFFRSALLLFDNNAAPVFTMNDSTFYDGILVGGRSSGQTQFWTIENTAFDGTGFRFTDYYNGGSSYTLFNYNAYNTNNLAGLTIPYPYGATTNFLEVVGPNDRMVTNFNWQSSWFGSFYLPTNSPIVNKGSTNANLLGLYHFTVTTNQVPEGTNIVSIGYHYVATGTNGLPLDSNGDGIPDYLEDPLGNGLPYNGTNWALAILTQPYSQTNNQGSNVTFSVVADGVPSLSYQWYFNGTEPIVGANTSSLTLDNIQYGDIDNYSVVVTNQFGSITSSVVSLTINVTSITFSNFCDTSILQINGNALETNISGDCVLELTPAAPYQGGSAYLKLPLLLLTNSSFSTYFSFRLSKGAAATNSNGSVGADGITFVIQTLTNNLGAVGGNLGYGGITNSMAIEFDTWYNTNPDVNIVDPNLPAGETNANGSTTDGNHIGLDVNGNLNSIAYQHIWPPMNNGNVWYAWIDYNGAMSNLQVRISETNSRPVTANLTTNINITSYLGKTSAYVGFGGGTGYAYQQQDILSWQINPQYTPIGATNGLTVGFLSPTNGQFFAITPTNILLTVSVTNTIGSAISSVVFSNQTLSTFLGQGVAVTNSIYQFLWQLATNGTYNITVTVFDDAGNVATNGITITNNAMPSVAFIVPTNTQSFLEVTNVELSVSASDSDGTITNVQFYAYNGATNNLLGNLTSPNGGGLYNLIWSNRITGVYPIFAVATDNRGASSVSQLKIFQVVPTNPYPAVAITFPTNNEVFDNGSDITITATATNSPAAVTNVQFLVNGSSIGSTTNAPYAISQCCWLPGTYQIVAIATDNFGSSMMSSNVEITILPEPPANEGFWDATYHPINSGLEGNQIPADECSNYVNFGTPAYSTVYGSNYYLTSLDLVEEGSADHDAGSLYQSNGTNWLRSGTVAYDEVACPPDFPFGSPEQPMIGGVAVNNTGMYVGGFDSSGTYYIVEKWNGTSWTPLGNSFSLAFYYSPGSEDRVSQLVQPQLQFIGSELYLFGDFKYNSNTNVQFIAEWNPQISDWEPVGSLLNAPVYAVAGLRGNLVVGGAFTSAGGNTNANFIAELVNGQWQGLGGGIGGFDNLYNYTNNLNPIVFSMAACNTNLFVGGDFTSAGKQTNVNGIARWDGLQWTAMGSGLICSNYNLWAGAYPLSEPPTFMAFSDYLNPMVYTISAHGNTVYVGGLFTDAINANGVDVPAASIARATWDDNAQQWVWADMDGGLFYTSSYPEECSLVTGVNTTAIMEGQITGPNAGAYDVIVAGPEIQQYQGLEENQFLGVSRWRVGYPAPPGLPSVTITNPANYFVTTNYPYPSTPTNVLIAATATVSYPDIISKVDFYVDGVNSHTDNTMGTNSFYFNWSNPGFGAHIVTAVATDSNNLAASSAPIVINVKNQTNTISAVNDLYNIPANSPAVVLLVLTNDTPGSGLKISSVIQPNKNYGIVNISYNQAYLTYTPLPDKFGSDVFYYTITNAAGAVDSAAVTVNIITAPVINSPTSQSIIQIPAAPLAVSGIVGNGGSGFSVTNITLLTASTSGVQMTNQTPVNGTFSFNWTNNLPGFYTFTAVALLGNGFTNPSVPVTVILYNSNAAPDIITASISNLVAADNSVGYFSGQMDPVITNGNFELYGRAADSITTNPVSYQILLFQPNAAIADATTDTNEQAVLYESGTPFANLTPGPLNAQGFHIGGDNNGDLGPLNLTAIPNGIYELILNVRGGAYQTNVLVEVQLDSQLKIGQFSFSQQDLVLPVNGVPITVTRTYNSLNPNAGDFGCSWTYAINSMNVQLDETRQNVVVGGNQDAYSSGPPGTYSVRNGGGYDVTLTLPNGQPATFAFSLGGGPDYDSESAQWTAPPWVHATLQPLDANGRINQYADSIYFIYDPPTWGNAGNLEGVSAPLENQDLPGWILTTQPDGTEYFITRGSPTNIAYPDANNPGSSISATVYGSPTLTKIVERAGDTIVISPNSIYHQDTNGTNRVVNFTRDAWGRITAISDPNSGTNGFPAIQYIYNQATSNLIQVLKLVDRNAGTYTTNLYDYNNPNLPHYITSVEDGDGVSVARNYYDSSGRLSGVQDAYGNLTQFIYSSTNSEMIVDPLGRTNSFVYDGNGNVLIKTNALNQVTTMAYDVNNNQTNTVTYLNGQRYATNSSLYDPALNLPLVSVDPLGHANSFTYDAFGNLETSTDARNNTTTNVYNPLTGQLVSTSDALGDTTSNNYNGTLLVSSSDAIETTTYNSYDASENLIGAATVDASNRILSTNSYTYDNNGNSLTSTVWRHVSGNWTPATTTNVYDGQNRVIETIDPDGGTNTTVYNAIGKQQATIDPLGHTNSYVYDDQGRLIQTIYPDGTAESSAYDAVGNRTNSVDRNGNITTYQYDPLNRLTNTIYADNTISSTVYDGVGRVAKTIDARDTVTAFAYDQAGRQLAVTNALGIAGIQNVSSYSYDNNGNQLAFTDANLHTTTNVFDALNRQVQVKYPDGTTNSTGYDADGRSVAQTNQAGIFTLFGYDGAGRLISVTNALNQVTRYQYDEAGNQTNQIDALNRTNAYAFDGMGRRISHMMPGGQIEGFTYDWDGNQIYQTNFNGAVITNRYNMVNRLTNCSSINGYNVSFAYSPTGQRTNMVDISGATAYVYDVRDRLLLKTNSWNNGPGISLNYRYDVNGNVTNIWSSTIAGVNLAYNYDPLNRLTNVLANGNAAAGYGFDLAGNLQAMRYGNGVTNLYQYDSLNRLTNLTWKLNVSSLANFSYLLGMAGNRTNLTESVNGTNRVYSWQYDQLYRLTNENFNASSNLAYSYDPVGNRTNRYPTIAGVAATVAGLTNQNFTFNTNDWLTIDKYDNNGSTITNSTGIYYKYDVMNHLTNMNGSVFVSYDGDGNRVSETVGSTTTFYLLDDRNPSGYAQVLEEWTVTATTTNLSKVYNYGLNLISQRVPSTSTNYFVFDGHGSTRLLLDAGGNVTNLFAYDAYGMLIASNTSPQTTYLYCGQQFDQNLGFYYNRARYLNANAGRFWTMDTYDGDSTDPLSLHKYLYVEADPIDNDDPLGRDVYKLVVEDNGDAMLGLIHHRVIVGDDGHGGSYSVEFYGDRALMTTGNIHYTPHAKLNAAQAIMGYIGNASVSSPVGSSGYIDHYVQTDQSVDSALNQAAHNLNGKPASYVFIAQDCGTFANEWIWLAAHPYSLSSTGVWGKFNPLISSLVGVDDLDEGL